MKKLLTLGMLLAGALSMPQFAVADEPEPVADTAVVATPYYVRGARIIHVPQRDEIERPERRVDLRDDREVSAPPPRRQVAPKPQRRADAPPPRKPFSVSPPPPPGPRRAVLSAPPPPGYTPPVNSTGEVPTDGQ